MLARLGSLALTSLTPVSRLTGSGSSLTARPAARCLASLAGDMAPKTDTSKRRRSKAASAEAGADAGAEPSSAVTRSSPRKRKQSTKAAEGAAPEAEEVTPAQAEAAEAAGEQPSPKPARGQAKRTPAASQKAAAAPAAAAGGGEGNAEAEPTPKQKRAKAGWPPGPLYEASMRPAKCEAPAYRFMSWNVAGLRALLKKDAGAIKKLVDEEQLDALCLQETKLQESHVEAVIQELGLQGWHACFNSSTAKKGYSGVATLCREAPLSSRLGFGEEQHDAEGRVVSVELPDVWLVNVYTPNSGEGLKRIDYRINEWDKALAAHLKGLQASKPVVVTGDLNCAHREIDIANPKTNLKSAGFTPEERASFESELLQGVGLTDTFRQQHPGVVGYTYYSYRFKARETGKGWRLDYYLVSNALAARVHDSYILKTVEGSDHVPLGLVLRKQ